MKFLLYCLLLVPVFSQEAAKPAEVAANPNPTGVSNGNGVFGQTVPVQPSYQPEVYPTYQQGFPEYGYQPYPLKKTEDNAVVSTLGRVLPVLRFFIEEYSHFHYGELILISQAFHLILKIVGKVALFLLGGAALLLVGGAFTAAVCYVTPMCTFSFMGYGLSQDQVRSLLAPDNISMATNFVNEALDKYQKLQGVL